MADDEKKDAAGEAKPGVGVVIQIAHVGGGRFQVQTAEGMTPANVLAVLLTVTEQVRVEAIVAQLTERANTKRVVALGKGVIDPRTGKRIA